MTQATPAKAHLTREHVQALLKRMLRIRRFEEKCAELYTLEKIRGFLHLYIGEEAIAVGVMVRCREGACYWSSCRWASPR